jgi:hypothetical protein
VVKGGSVIFVNAKGNGPKMLVKLKKEMLPSKAAIFKIRWYPSTRSFLNRAGRGGKHQQIPPLMVRKAEWRR